MTTGTPLHPILTATQICRVTIRSTSACSLLTSFNSSQSGERRTNTGLSPRRHRCQVSVSVRRADEDVNVSAAAG
ncbi:hypothetical protein EYF80_053655 [Liparis tanakae]|uniref:Uncharacterized protein n=1 Tax=Liparis tanakae TaxID=230148 RepID=A0A4Z2F765_9TELE|nr:hypothetical protein EYF80_053655 [Liparis tanakae]